MLVLLDAARNTLFGQHALACHDPARSPRSARRGQALSPDQKQELDAALSETAPAKPKQARRMLVTNLSMRDGQPVRGSSLATVPSGNYAIEQIGKRTGA